MRKFLGITLSLAVMAGLFGCGDNKTKQKLIGTEVVSETSLGGTQGASASPDASSVQTLYKVSFMGSGAGSFSYSAPRRYGAPSLYRAPSADEGIGLGTVNANGEYTVSDTMGETVTIKFQKGTETVYMDFSNCFSASELYMYDSQSLSSSKTTINQNTNFEQLMLSSWPKFIPSIWIKNSNKTPMEWYTVTLAGLNAGLTDLGDWMMDTFPDKMTTTVTGAIPGGTMNLTMTSQMPDGRPTDTNPVTMTGNGTITFDTGEVWTVTANMTIGENGPIGGTQTFSSTSGETGVMTFSSDGSMDGTISQNGTVVATVHINVDGTGTYTDVTTGKTYTITDAKPA